jgi:tetratricopeptide (TPR) repeat protein
MISSAKRDGGRRRPRRAAALLALAMLCVASGALAQAQKPPAPAQPEAPPFGATDQERYNSCMAMTQHDPKAALREAQAWRKEGGGDPALHCVAVSLLGIGEYQQAALNLESLSRSQRITPALRGDLLGQAGNAWTLARKPAEAYKDQTAALKLKPDDVDLLIDRSMTLSGSGKYWEALDDLNRALTLDPTRADALVYRASAWRHLKTYDLAEDDATRALTLQPDRLDALLERGAIRKARGNRAGARTDWLRLVDIAADGPMREAARKELELMDVRPAQKK